MDNYTLFDNIDEPINNYNIEFIVYVLILLLPVNF